jgi:hypothetical protein
MRNPVNIRFISSLDTEDEIRFATAILAGLSKILDEMPIAYTIRMETATGKVIEHHHGAALMARDASELWKNPAPAEKSASNGSNVSQNPQDAKD